MGKKSRRKRSSKSKSGPALLREGEQTAAPTALTATTPYERHVLQHMLKLGSDHRREYRLGQKKYAESAINLIHTYIEGGEFLTAKEVHDETRSLRTNVINWCLSVKIEAGLCNYKAAIEHFRKFNAVLQQNQKAFWELSYGYLYFATLLLKHTADNETEAFLLFQKELDRCEEAGRRESVLLRMGTEYRKLKKWDQSIETLHQLCLSASRPESTMQNLGNRAMAQTYLELYCTEDIDQQNDVLNLATEYAQKVDERSMEMYLTYAQISYFRGDKQRAYHHLEIYLVHRMSECDFFCYTCEQRIRDGSVPFSCASCRVASYCGRRHQRMTWKNERICHKVLCPLLGYWRVARKKSERTTEDQSQKETVFKTFFESICPPAKACVPSCVH